MNPDSTIFDLNFFNVENTLASNNLQTFFEEFKQYTINELWIHEEPN